MTEEKKLASQVLTLLIAYPLKAWLLMLTLGGIHSHYSQVPAIGYGVSFMTIIAAGCLFAWGFDQEDK